MTTKPPTDPPPAGAAPPLITRTGWFWLAGIAVLFFALFGSVISRMFRIATDAQGGTWPALIKDVITTPWNHDWSHAVVVPLISGYFIYQHRHHLAATPTRVCLPGLAVFFAGLFSFAWWIFPGRNDMLQGYSMIVALFGLVLFLLGPRAMRVLWFPIFYLALAVKISDRFWEQIAWKLQLTAARCATVALQLLGIDADVQGSTISLGFMRQGLWVEEAMNVAEACSGLRMLMAFVALGTAMAYLMNRVWWQRLIMLALILPIAVLVNVGRVTVLGILFLTNKEMASGDFHTFVGMLMLIPAAVLFALLGWVLDHLLIADPTATRDTTTAPKAPASTLPDKPPATTFTPKRLILGLVAGVILTLTIGADYGLLLASSRPDVFDYDLPRSTIQGLLVLGLALLAAGLWGIRKLVKPESRPAGGPGPASLSIAVGILLAASASLSAVIQITRTVLIKEAVPLREPLYRIPEVAGEWEMISEDPPLGAEALQALGTNDYISRNYRHVDAQGNPIGPLARLHIAYYTGTPDTVPHVPDRCFVAGGIDPIGTAFTTLQLAGPAYRNTADVWTAHSRLNPAGVTIPADEFSATIFTFSQKDRPTLRSNVIYFFAANGKFLSTPDLVRAHGFDPRDRYSYYCKVEVGLFGIDDPQDAAEKASMFLSAIMPEVMACLPDWDRLTADSEQPATKASTPNPR